MKLQLTCPSCGQPITAEHINIQKMVAVCPACHSVFQFEPQRPKSKHRKVKRPKPLILEEDQGDRVHMAFRTNFRLDKNQDFIGQAILSVIFSFISIMMMVGFFIEGDMPFFLPLAFLTFSAIMYYMLALTVYNRTHIDIDEDSITVSRQPLPNFSPVREVDLANVNAIRCEETPASVREGFDTPRFNVYAETVDGRRSIILSDVTEEYGFFITQILNERLVEHPDEAPFQATMNLRLDDEPAHHDIVTHDGELPMDDTLNHSAKGKR